MINKIVVLAVLGCAFQINCFSQEKTKTNSTYKVVHANQYINCSIDKKHVNIYSGDVLLKTSNFTIYSDSISINDNDVIQGFNNTKIVAKDGFSFTTDHFTYNMLTGNLESEKIKTSILNFNHKE